MAKGIYETGVYSVTVVNGESSSVVCDMDTDGGAWTVRITASSDYAPHS